MNFTTCSALLLSDNISTTYDNFRPKTPTAAESTGSETPVFLEGLLGGSTSGSRGLHQQQPAVQDTVSIEHGQCLVCVKRNAGEVRHQGLWT